MGDTEDTTPAGRYLQQRMNDLGYKTKADLADTAGVSRSTITRLFKNPDYRPDVDVMRRLARGLQVEHDELVAAVYGEASSPPAATAHPVVAELGRLLADDSPMDKVSRAALAAVVKWGIEGVQRAREELASDVATLAQDGGMLAVGATEARRALGTPPEPEAPSTLAFLGALLRPDSPISDNARQALRQIVASALHLGEEAMLLHDARHGMSDAEVLERVREGGQGRAPMPQQSEHRRVAR